MNQKTKERAADYLGSLVRCREAVAEFYQACADVWPDGRTLWQRLAQEEASEAVSIALVRERVLRTPHGVGLLKPYPVAVIQNFIESVESDTRLVRTAGMTAETARLRARDRAQSLIVSQPLRGFSFDDPRFARYWEETSVRIAAYVRLAIGGRGHATPSQPQAA
jgi:hypothetical protein